MQTRTTYPYFKLFAAAFRSDTEAMTAEEIGAYIMLLCRAWTSEPVGSIAKEDDDTLAIYARVPLERWKVIGAKVLKNFRAKKTMFVSELLTCQWNECEETSETARTKATKRWNKKVNHNVERERAISNSGAGEQVNVI